jgi:hypothetical protein
MFRNFHNSQGCRKKPHLLSLCLIMTLRKSCSHQQQRFSGAAKFRLLLACLPLLIPAKAIQGWKGIADPSVPVVNT